MDKQQLFDALGVQPAPLFITDMHTLTWGQTLILTCLYQPHDGTALTFHLVFTGCRESKWLFYSHIPTGDIAYPKTELVNLRLGKPYQRRPAQFLTEHFGLSLSYEEWTLEIQNG